MPEFDFSFTHEQYQDLLDPNREGGYQAIMLPTAMFLCSAFIVEAQRPE